jgi:hypothetical protein
MKAADESCQSTPQSRHGFVCAGKYPYFPVYFACPMRISKLRRGPFLVRRASAVEGEGHAAWFRSIPPPIRKGPVNLILIQATTGIQCRGPDRHVAKLWVHRKQLVQNSGGLPIAVLAGQFGREIP